MSILDEVINQGSIKEMLDYYGIEKQRNGKYLCPFHNDTHASLSVTDDDKHWQCFTCNEKGNIYNLVEKMEALRGNTIDFVHGIDMIIKLQNLNIEFVVDNKQKKQLTPEQRKQNRYYGIMNDARTLAVNRLNYDKEYNGRATQYLKSRRISEDTIKVFHIGYNDRSMLQDNLTSNYEKDDLFNVGVLAKNKEGEYYDFQYDRLLIPIHNAEGKCVAFGGRILEGKSDMKYKNTKTTDIFKKSQILFNYHIARRYAKTNNELLVVEGYFDAISAYEIGIKNTVALMGVELSAEHKEMIKQLNVPVTLCLDNDNAGRVAMCKIIPELIAEGIEVNVLDTQKLNKGKDMNDYLMNDVTVEDLEKVKVSAVDFLFSYSFDFYENKNNNITIDIVKKVYDTVFKDEHLNNSLNEVKFNEYVSRRYGYSKDEIKAACHPTQNNTLLSNAMQNYFCMLIKEKLQKYALSTDNRVLQSFLAQGRLKHRHIMEGFNNDKFIQNNGTRICVIEYCEQYLMNTPEYKEFEKVYDRNFERLLKNVYAFDKSGEIVQVYLTPTQKDMVVKQFNASFDDDVKQYFKDENDRFVKLYIADTLLECERFLGNNYSVFAKDTSLNLFNEGKMSVVNYQAAYKEEELATLHRLQPLQYTTDDGSKYQAVLVFNNTNNELQLKPENYIKKQSGDTVKPHSVIDTLNQEELPTNLPPVESRQARNRGNKVGVPSRSMLHQNKETKPDE